MWEESWGFGDVKKSEKNKATHHIHKKEARKAHKTSKDEQQTRSNATKLIKGISIDFRGLLWHWRADRIPKSSFPLSISFSLFHWCSQHHFLCYTRGMMKKQKSCDGGGNIGKWCDGERWQSCWEDFWQIEEKLFLIWKEGILIALIRDFVENLITVIKMLKKLHLN